MLRYTDAETEFVEAKDYRNIILDQALTGSVVACVGFEASKTYLTLMLIREMASLTRLPLCQGGKRCAVCLSNDSLVHEEAAKVRLHTNLSVQVHLEHPGDESQWLGNLDAYQVHVFSVAHLENILRRGFKVLSHLNLIVMNDCHKVLNNPSYKCVLNMYALLPKDSRPVILGLTDFLETDSVDAEQLLGAFKVLESYMHCRLVTAHPLLIPARLGAKPILNVRVCRNDDDNSWSGLTKTIRSHIMATVEWTRRLSLADELDQDCTRCVVDAMLNVVHVLEELGPWCAWRVCIMQERQLIKLNKYCMSDAQQALILMGETYLKMARMLLESRVKGLKTVDQLEDNLTGRAWSLVQWLRNEGRCKIQGLPDKSFCGVIIVRRQFIACLLKTLLKTLQTWHPETFGYYVTDALVLFQGNAARAAHHKRQEDVMRRFRIGEINLLIVTCALSESVEARRCDFIIRFDPPSSFYAYVHAKKFARKRGSEFIMLLQQKSVHSFQATLKKYADIEKVLADHSAVIDLARNHEECHLEEGTVNGESKNCCTPYKAIEIINRYCMRLPSDIFTRLVPELEVKPCLGADGGQRFVGCMRLPINSPLKEPIQSCPVVSKRQAVMAVAMKAAHMLHEQGELNDQFQPIGKSALAKLLIDCEDDEIWPTHGKALPGSNRRKQVYEKKVPEALLCTMPEPEKPAFIYAINIHGDSPEVWDQCSGRSIGLLTCKAIPLVPLFALFPRVGSIMVGLSRLDGEHTVNSAQILLISRFHEYVFSDILRLEKFTIKYNPSQAAMSFFVVPLIERDGRLQLDWSFVVETVKFGSQSLARPSEEERKKFTFNAERYMNAVVMPWYRINGNTHFYNVLDVCQDLTPSSQFPDEEYDSFESYYKHKYNLAIYCPCQPLLNVDYSASRLNILLPRANKDRPSEEGASLSVIAQKQKLIPELVIVHPIPSSFWKMLVCLPSILYRLTHLLLADDLRARILRESVHAKQVEPVSSWPPMDAAWLRLAARCSEISSSMPNPVSSNVGSKATSKQDKSKLFDNLDFEISVWNPDDAQVVQSQSSVANDLERANSNSTEENTEAAPLDQADGTDDIPSDEDDIYFDVDFRLKLMQAKQLPESELERIFQPPPGCIEPSGWDSVDNSMVTSFSNNGGQGLQFLSIASHVDATSLLADIRDAEMKVQKPAVPKVEEMAESKKEQPKKVSMPKKEFALPRSSSIDEAQDCDIPSHESRIDLVALVGDAPLVPAKEIEFQRSVQLGSVCAASCQQGAGGFKEAPELSADALFAFTDEGLSKSAFGPNPRDILEALTTATAHDVFSLEGLEIIGDSFLKFVVTVYHFKMYPEMHEGKLSLIRGRQVSNYNLYKLGKRRGIGELMVNEKFEPMDNWLPPGYVALGNEAMEAKINEEDLQMDLELLDEQDIETLNSEIVPTSKNWLSDDLKHIMPEKLFTRQTISDKSIADCVEALIGVFLLHSGTQGAINFVDWLGIKVFSEGCNVYTPVKSPLIRSNAEADRQLLHLWNTFGLGNFECILGYRFRDRAYLIQALCHSSYTYNHVTDCYQRLEFLGDAVLDYLITRHLYENTKMHSPGVLTDLRSALVNNTIFSSLAVKYDFHKYFMVLNPNLLVRIETFVQMISSLQADANLDSELYLLEEEGDESEEDVEVPKALGDIFESVAGAIFLDSGCSLYAVWRVYYRMMHEQIQKCCASPPVSPVRELMEMEPERTTFERAERNLIEGKVRVTAHVHGVGMFTGAGRSFRIAKTTAAKRALRYLRRLNCEYSAS